MRIEMMNTGILGVNTYIVFNDELHECVVIDAGGDFQRLSNYIAENGATCKAVLLTHGHFDHIGAAKEFQDNGAVVYIHKADEDFTLTPSSAGYPSLAKTVKPFSADKFVNDGDVLKLAGLDILVIHTPGHSKGSVTYKIESNLFCGDTLFCHSIGRTDLPGGDYDEIMKSIENKLFCFSNMKVFPGHDQFSTIDDEKINNPFFI
ncbi:MAG: MBL fold metallo-hydrolase [Clostridia bacterium]